MYLYVTAGRKRDQQSAHVRIADLPRKKVQTCFLKGKDA